jgi:hypothetical protein
MKRLILVAPVRLVGIVACRVPSCLHSAAAHIDIYMAASGDQSWDARSSGPFCQSHLERMRSDWADCEVLSESSMKDTSVEDTLAN